MAKIEKKGQKWEVKLSKAERDPQEKAKKSFDTEAEAIAYQRQLHRKGQMRAVAIAQNKSK